MTETNVLNLLKAGPTLYKKGATFNLDDSFFDDLMVMTQELNKLNSRFKVLYVQVQVDEVLMRYGRVFVMLHSTQYVKVACCRGYWSVRLANAMVWLARYGADLYDYRGLARAGLYIQALTIIKQFTTKVQDARTT